jgi:putative heme degradation protein
VKQKCTENEVERTVRFVDGGGVYVLNVHSRQPERMQAGQHLLRNVAGHDFHVHPDRLSERNAHGTPPRAQIQHP